MPGSLSGLLPSAFPTKILYVLAFPILLPEEPLMKFKDYEFPYYESFSTPPATGTLVGPNIFLRTLFSETLSLCLSLNMTDQGEGLCDKF
jgi:hypothetical protein